MKALGLGTMQKKQLYHRKITTYMAVIMTSLPVMASAKSGKSATTALAVPDAAHSLETLHRSVTAIGRFGDRLITLPTAMLFAIDTPMRGFGKSRQDTFGAITDSVRKPVLPDDAKKLQTIDWRGVDIVDHKALLLNGTEMAVVEADATTLKMVARRSVPWDLIKPAADPQGEPTRPEIADTRVDFKKQLIRTLGTKFAGMARLPASWFKSKQRAYLVATRIPSFPLLVMECGTDDPSACMITRQCNLAGDKPETGAITGIAISAAQRLVVIGDSAKHRLVGYAWRSCFDVRQARSWTVPKQLRALGNIAIDADETLWVATKVPDDYLNASVFAWPKGTW